MKLTTRQKPLTNRSRLTSQFFFIAFIVVFLSSCATSTPKRKAQSPKRNYQISVKAGGTDLVNFEQQLVHRIEITRNELQSILITWPESLNLSFRSIGEYDKLGQAVGIKIIDSSLNSSSANLGLKSGDIVTSIGRKLPTSTRDFWPLLNELKQTGTGDISISRNGRANKILLQLKN